MAVNNASEVKDLFESGRGMHVWGVVTLKGTLTEHAWRYESNGWYQTTNGRYDTKYETAWDCNLFSAPSKPDSQKGSDTLIYNDGKKFFDSVAKAYRDYAYREETLQQIFNNIQPNEEKCSELLDFVISAEKHEWTHKVEEWRQTQIYGDLSVPRDKPLPTELCMLEQTVEPEQWILTRDEKNSHLIKVYKCYQGIGGGLQVFRCPQYSGLVRVPIDSGENVIE